MYATGLPYYRSTPVPRFRAAVVQTDEPELSEMVLLPLLYAFMISYNKMIDERHSFAGKRCPRAWARDAFCPPD
jgi:hypothetical protein